MWEFLQHLNYWDWLALGTVLAWVLVRYTFPGRKVIDAMIDLPFALPTAVAGIALTALYAPNGWIGQFAADLGFKIAYTPMGITLALTFVTLPFVVRTVQPVLADIPREIEEAAACLGAKPLQVFRYILVPALLPAWLTGFALAFARGVGEYGSVIFIAGNMPFKTCTGSRCATLGYVGVGPASTVNGVKVYTDYSNTGSTKPAPCSK